MPLLLKFKPAPLGLDFNPERKGSHMTASESNNQPIGHDQLTEYIVDAGQRAILFWDALRQRGNQYHEHMAHEIPHVLDYEFELIVDGRTLSEPVNYGLVKIIPPKNVKIDDHKRPFVVVDPRAGHGPGIGGFKADSEIGVILAEGHPCYFIGFSPEPEPGQSIEAIMRAQGQFLERIVELHPNADGKPVVIGNCQAGWAVMMLAATYPDLCGPIIAAGAPVSYWAGVRGENPMRYTGGMLGGSWLTALTSDLGNGRFDGAWLVQNFEGLNPANTLWSKQYNLYAKIDTEVPRYLGFERWWGGHAILNGGEIQDIVDYLFVGNKLSTAGIQTSDGLRIDLRNIRAPIVCFCSKGDNITPPQQALGWILDLYDSVDDIRASGQTIIYAVHESVGHLGIFVSGSVAKKEHSEFASNIDFIDCLPPGLYEAVMEKTSADTDNAELVTGDYISRFERRTLDDIRALGGNDLDDERCFAAVARLSEITHGIYRTIAQPLVRATATEQSADWLRRMHPLRLGYELFSDHNPLMASLPSAAQSVRDHRAPAAEDNIFLQWQHIFSGYVTQSLNIYRDWRDMMMEQMFFGIYSQPWLQAALGLRASDEPPRRNPGQEPDHLALIEHQKQALLARMDQGGPRKAVMRGLIYVRMPEGKADERGFEMIRRIRAQLPEKRTLAEFKEAFREQFLMVLLDEQQAVAAIPTLLKGHQGQGPELFEMIRKVVTAGDPLGKEAQGRLTEIEKLFVPRKTAKPKKPKARSKSAGASKGKAAP
jgi:pimeloyl-ACP methyl ester carboxylesterase